MIFTHKGIPYNSDDALSFRDFTGMEFLSRPGITFTGKVIRGSCFSQEVPDTVIFRGLLTSTIFVLCNLSNVMLPAGATEIDCQRTRFRVQNDLRDWETDTQGIPIKVLGERYWQDKGYSVDPADIPAVRLTDIEQIRRV